MQAPIKLPVVDRQGRRVNLQSIEAPQPQFDAIADALKTIRQGRMVVVVDDESRENEGALMCSAQFVTPQIINFMALEPKF